MKEKFLIINAGSSSLKFSLYDTPDMVEIVNGLVEKIGYEDSFYTLKYDQKKVEKSKVIRNHTEAVQTMIEELLAMKFINSVDEIKGVGHRVLHGGELYSESVVIDDEVLKNIKDLTKFGPLHHPGEIAGIQSMQEVIPNAIQVAVFDTAFHQTIPEENYMYAVPYEWYKEYGVRKYGFHGTSHKYITETMKHYFNKENVNLIICHLGSGASISCIKDGKSYNTTMGLTPLDGLIMGTRCGNIDSSIIEYICKEKNISVSEVNDILNKKSGVIGIAGKNDFRDLEMLANNGDQKAKLAIKMFINSVIKFVVQYYAELRGDVDAVIFTAGIGENQVMIRREIVNSLSNIMGVELDSKENDNIGKGKENNSGIITTSNSKVKFMVIPTNEEYMILQDTFELSNCKSFRK